MREILLSAALLVALAACAKPAAHAANASDQAASSNAPVHWDMASADPAKNPTAANKEASAPGYVP